MSEPHQRSQAPTGFEVYHWPEFIALCNRLGVPHHLRTVEMTIHVKHDQKVAVTHVYQGQDRDNVPPADAQPSDKPLILGD